MKSTRYKESHPVMNAPGNSTHKDLLLGIINGTIDSRQIAIMEMENRGLDINSGKWIGWYASKKKAVPPPDEVAIYFTHV